VPAQGSLKTLDGMRAWQRKLHAAGFLGAAWPKEYGGAGLPEMEQAILNEERARVRAPQVVNAMAIWWVGPAIIRYGTDAQKKRFIPPILTADEIWATGYSEPTSGSDMAAAKTRAVRDGDVYVVNGQKIWTTYAHISDWFFVLVRTSPEGPKWAGLSLLLMDPRGRQRIAQLATKAAIVRYAGLRTLTDSLRGRMNPHLSAAMKLSTTQLTQELSETAMEVLGPYAALMDDAHAPSNGRWAKQ